VAIFGKESEVRQMIEELVDRALRADLAPKTLAQALLRHSGGGSIETACHLGSMMVWVWECLVGEQAAGDDGIHGVQIIGEGVSRRPRQCTGGDEPAGETLLPGARGIVAIGDAGVKALA
jgi:hypothetical protein